MLLDSSCANLTIKRRAALCILISRVICESVKTYLVRWLPLCTLSEQKGYIAVVVFRLIVLHSSVVVVVAGCHGEVGGWGVRQSAKQHRKADQGDQHMHLE